MTVWDDPVGFDPLRDGPPYLGNHCPKVASAGAIKERVATELPSGLVARVREWATQCLEFCGNAPRVELSVLLKALQGAVIIHQANHWQSEGTTAYEDHLLFQRIYEGTDEFVDSLAEKSVGMGNASFVNPVAQSRQVHLFVQTLFPNQDQLTQTDRALVSQYTVGAVLFLIDWALRSLESRNQLSNGIDNMLQGIADKHEEFAYLLQQRLTVSASREDSGWKA